mgnify:CR=1 FL=1
MIFSIYEITNSDEYKYENFIRNDVLDTDYGVVNKNGTYDVDDYSRINFEYGNRKWELMADWRTLDEDHREITFIDKSYWFPT